MALNFDTREPILEPLSHEEAVGNGFTHRLRIDHEYLKTQAGTSKTFNFGLNKGAIIEATAHACTTAFVGAAVTALVVKAGNDAESDNWVPAKECVSGSVDADSFATPGTVLAAADNLDVVVTATGANLSVLTAGEVYLFFRIANVRELAKD